MADTMTLEQALIEALIVANDGRVTVTRENCAKWADAIDAAIRERDRLRGDVSGMTEELLHVPSREEWRALQKRAERAEAELAALKARMKPCARVRDGEVHVYMDTAHEGKEVAVVVVEE